MVLLKQIAKLGAQLKSVAGVITAVMVISGVTLALTKTKNSNQAEQNANFAKVYEGIEVLNQNVEYLSIENSDQNEQLQGISDSLFKIAAADKKHSADIGSVAWAITQINNFTPEQLEEILSRELKKNSVQMTPLILDIPEWWIQEPETELILSNMR